MKLPNRLWQPLFDLSGMEHVTLKKNILYSISSFFLKILGWRVSGKFPDLSKFVLVVAPHTSNWDFVIAYISIMSLTRGFATHSLKGFGKIEWFWGPLDSIFRFIGGIPVHRGKKSNVVLSSISMIEKTEKIILALTPEGTRKRTEKWKSGFYYIAIGAKIPVVCFSLDYQSKVAGVGPTIWPSGDIDSDIRLFQEFYRPVIAKYPDQVTDVIL